MPSRATTITVLFLSLPSTCCYNAHCPFDPASWRWDLTPAFETITKPVNGVCLPTLTPSYPGGVMVIRPLFSNRTLILFCAAHQLLLLSKDLTLLTSPKPRISYITADHSASLHSNPRACPWQGPDKRTFSVVILSFVTLRLLLTCGDKKSHDTSLETFRGNLLRVRFPRWRQRCKRCEFSPWFGKMPWRRKWQPAPIFLSGKSYRQRRLVGYSPCGHKESDTTELHTHILCLAELPWMSDQGVGVRAKGLSFLVFFRFLLVMCDYSLHMALGYAYLVGKKELSLEGELNSLLTHSGPGPSS